MNSIEKPAKSDDDLFLIKGVLSELHVENGRENLLARIEKRYRVGSAVTGLAAAAGDMFGQVGSALMLATYDGEDTENFACLVDDQILCGQFGGASKLKEGSRIKAVVSRRGDVLYAHAIMDQKEAMLWTHHAWGASAERKANLKMAMGFGAFGTVAMFVVDLFYGPGYSSFSVDLMVFAAICFGLCLIVALWSNRTMQALAGPATQAFGLLGFAMPERVNLNRHQYYAMHVHEIIRTQQQPRQFKDVYCYQKALDSGVLRYATDGL